MNIGLNKFNLLSALLGILILSQNIFADRHPTMHGYEVLKIISTGELESYERVAIKDLKPNDRVVTAMLDGDERTDIGWAYVDDVNISRSQSSEIYIMLKFSGSENDYSDASGRDLHHIVIYSNEKGDDQEIVTLDELQNRFTYERDLRNFYVLDYKFKNNELVKAFKKIESIYFHFRWGSSLSFHTDSETALIAEPGQDDFVYFSCHANGYFNHEQSNVLRWLPRQYYKLKRGLKAECGWRNL